MAYSEDYKLLIVVGVSALTATISLALTLERVAQRIRMKRNSLHASGKVLSYSYSELPNGNFDKFSIESILKNINLQSYTDSESIQQILNDFLQKFSKKTLRLIDTRESLKKDFLEEISSYQYLKLLADYIRNDEYWLSLMFIRLTLAEELKQMNFDDPETSNELNMLYNSVNNVMENSSINAEHYFDLLKHAVEVFRLVRENRRGGRDEPPFTWI